MHCLTYEKPDENAVTNVSAILGPAKCNGDEREASDQAIIKREFNRDKKGSFSFCDFNLECCNVTFNVHGN